MAQYSHPGVYFNEIVPQDRVPINNTAAVVAFVGSVDRGPTSPVLLSNANDLQRYLGNFTGVTAQDTLLQACYDAFRNGAANVWINRAPGTGSAIASVTLNTAGSPGTPSLMFSAKNSGTWGNQLYIEVRPGTVAGYFSVTLRSVPVGAAITNAQIIETLNNLSLNPLDGRYAITVLNSLTNPDAYITASLVAGYTYSAGDSVATSSVLPGGDKMSGGVNGTRDGGVNDAAARQAAVYAFDVITSPFVLNVPGVNDAATVQMLASYADASLVRADGLPGRGDVFVIVDGDGGPGASATTPASVATKNLTYLKSDVVAVYYPWLVIPDPVNGNQGVTKLVPPGPSVAGRYMATDVLRGPFKTPAGVSDGRINNVIMLDPSVNNGSGFRSSDLDVLFAANVNVIKPIANSGPAVIYGGRTLQSGSVTRYVSARRTLIYARAALRDGTAFAAFENNDNTLWSHLYSVADTICRQLFSVGGLAGTTPQQAYFVICDKSNNTPTTIAAGETHLDVGLALQRPSEFMVISIGQFQSGAAVISTSSNNTAPTAS